MSSAEVIVVGAGTAGLAAASELATRGARVVLVEKSERIGGTLHVSAGQMSAAGTRLQKARGIHDTPDLHFADAMRISKGTADPALVRRAVDLAPDTIDWLMDEGFDLDPVCPAILHYHEAYRLARTYWGREGGRSILAVLERVFGRAREIGRIDLRFGARLVGLEGTPGSAVTGIRIAAADGRETSVAADAVILASGGYGADRGRFARWTGGRPMFSACMPTSTGDGIAIAETFGARVDGGDLFLPTFGGVESEPGGEGVTAPMSCLSQRRKAGRLEVYVMSVSPGSSPKTIRASMRAKPPCSLENRTTLVAYDLKVPRRRCFPVGRSAGSMRHSPDIRHSCAQTRWAISPPARGCRPLRWQNRWRRTTRPLCAAVLIRWDERIARLRSSSRLSWPSSRMGSSSRPPLESGSTTNCAFLAPTRRSKVSTQSVRPSAAVGCRASPSSAA